MSSRGAYVWVTRIRGLIAGDAHCVWAAWHKAQGRYEKRVEDAESQNRLAQWKADHVAFVMRRIGELSREGWSLRVENQNRFVVRGQAVTVAGCADIVGLKPGEAYFEDCKTGERKESDAWQVVLYMLLLPMADDRFKGLTLRGAVTYTDGEPARPVSHDDALRGKEAVMGWIRLMASPTAPARTPSAAECRFCDIAACPERVSVEPEPATTDLF